VQSFETPSTTMSSVTLVNTYLPKAQSTGTASTLELKALLELAVSFVVRFYRCYSPI
jgi:hypothetical protein